MHINLHRWSDLLSSVFVMILLVMPAYAVITAAGTVIMNQAKVAYFDTAEGKVKHIYSNVSEITVKELFTFELEGGGTKKVSPAQKVSFPHRLINTGNKTANYEIKISPQQGVEAFDNYQLVLDINGDGQATPGESELSPVACEPADATAICFSVNNVYPGDITEFVIANRVPADVSVGEEFQYSIGAKPKEDTSKAVTVANKATVIGGANMVMSKQATPLCGTPVKPQDTVTFILGFSNIGSDKPSGRAFMIGDQQMEGAVLEDRILSNFTFNKNPEPVYSPHDAIVIVQKTEDDDSNRWIRFDDWDGVELISKVGLFVSVDQMQPNQSGHLSFELLADPNPTEGTLTNIAGFNLADGQDFDFSTNPVCVTLAEPTKFQAKDNKADIRFIKPVISLQKDDQVPVFGQDNHFEDAYYYKIDRSLSARSSSGYFLDRDGVYVELHSSASNLKEDIIDTVVVNLKSSTLPEDTLRLRLMETGPNTAVFRSLRVVRPSSSETGSNALCGANDNVANFSSNQSECKINGQYDDVLIVSYNDPGINTVIEDSAMLDPMGVVFDAALRTPIEGAKVTIKIPNGTPTPDDDEVAIDPLNGGAYENIPTNSSGRYVLPLLAPGNYYLSVEAPESYKDTSHLPASVFINYNVSDYSYGKDGFNNTTNSGVFNVTDIQSIDVPLDPKNLTAFELEKTSSISKVSIGEIITYNVKVTNHLDVDLFAIELDDHIPYGFRYVAGSTQLDGRSIDDPIGAPGPYLHFENVPFDPEITAGQLKANKTYNLSYTLRVTAGAIESDGVNTIVGEGNTETSFKLISNRSKNTVKVTQEGVLGEGGIVFGKVYVDANCDNLQSGGEWPIGGVKLYMEDGTWVITDGNGNYSLFGIKPGDHVIKVDPITLPEGIKLKPIDNRHMADPDSRLVDLKRGEFHRADFASMCPKDEADLIKDRLRARNTGRTDWMLETAQQFDPGKTNQADPRRNKVSADGDVSYGKVGLSQASGKKIKVTSGPRITRGFSVQLAGYPSEDEAKAYLEGLPLSLKERSFVYQLGDLYTVRAGFSLRKAPIRALHNEYSNYKKSRIVATIYERLSMDALDKLEAPSGVNMMQRPQDMAKHITKAQAKKGTWLWPKKDISLDGRFMVVTRAGIKPTLMVNGNKIPDSQIGERIKNKKQKAQIVAWYGVELRDGDNEVKVMGKDPFGNERVLAKGNFKRPSKPVLIKMQALTKKLPADGGRTYIPVKISILDKNGYPARGVNFITLETSDGSWVERDIQDLTPGKQIRIINGERTVHLRSSDVTGNVTLKAMDGDLIAEESVTQIAPLRPLLAAGLVSIGAKSNKFTNAMNAPGSLDETEIDGRTAFFMKGRIIGDMHLTLSYDSEKEEGGDRFRDVNPNAHYPLYGDDSQRGYEAQSRSPIYAKVEKGLNSAMWGDYVTDSKDAEGDVARTNRSLTGANVVLDNGKTRFQAYAAFPEENHITEELRGKGVALNYRIDKFPIVRNSETVEVITYSRENPGVVIDIQKLSRFTGYRLDDETGELSFVDSIPSLDENNNPVYIRVSYDVDEGGERYNVAGARVTHKFNENVNVGASVAVDDHMTDGKKLAGVTAQYKKDNTKVTASMGYLQHNDASKGEGNAVRIDVEQKWKNGTTNMTYARADKNYDNSAGGVSAGREEARINHRQKISKNVSMNVEGTHSKDLESGDAQQTLGVTSDVKVKGWTLKGGARHIRQEKEGESESFNTVIVGAKKAFKVGGRPGSVSTEYEQDIGQADRKRLAVGADLKIHDNVNVYAKAERINSLTGVGGLSSEAKTDTLSVGVKSNITKSTEMFSEYRLRGATSSQDSESATGIRGTYNVTKGIAVSPRIEVVRGHSGNAKDSVATSIAVQDTRTERARNSLRLEARHDDERDYVGLEASHVGRLDEQWSIMAKDTLRVEMPDEGDEKYENTFSIGLAHRPKSDNKHNLLFMYQNKLRKGYDDEDCMTHILSTHQSYELKEDLLWSGRLGGKHKGCERGGEDITSNAVVVDGRLIWDLNKRWDVDLHGGVLGTNDMKEQQYSAGIGINYLVRENLRVGAGYNITGFEEEDLDSEGYNKEGLYMGLQYKFDEKNLEWLGGKAANDEDEDKAIK